MRSRSVLWSLVVVLVMALVPLGSASAEMDTPSAEATFWWWWHDDEDDDDDDEDEIQICRRNRRGRYRLIEVEEDEQRRIRRIIRRGGGFPGDPVPRLTGHWFGPNCRPEDEPPVVEDQSFSIDENSPDGTVVGSIVFSDPDESRGDVVTLTVTGGSGATAFAVEGAGTITVDDSAQLDFETTPSFTLDVEVSDLAGMTDTALITIDLNDVPEGGGPTTLARAWSVDQFGGEVLVAQLEDTDGSGGVSVGDTVTTNQYPRDYTGTDFGSFTITSHTVTSVVEATSASVMVVSTGGTHDWVIDASPALEFYREQNGNQSTRTLLRDSFELANDDLIRTRPNSPSQPPETLNVQLSSPVDDLFIEVEITL